MDRQELIRENDKLMALRKKERIGKSQPVALSIPTPPAEMQKLTPASEVLSGDKTLWDAFNWGRHPDLAKAKPIIVDWYNGLPGSGALVLAGNFGSGKTHIAQAIYELFGKWRTSFYGEIALAKAIQRTYDDRSITEDGFIRQAIFRPELFVFDDLGTYQAKDLSWLGNIYSRIFEDYLTVMGKPLLITTNLPMIFIPKNEGDRPPFGAEFIKTRIGKRFFSRLCGAMESQAAYIDLFNVPDFRIERFLG